jgi:hypothetical protein
MVELFILRARPYTPHGDDGLFLDENGTWRWWNIPLSGAGDVTLLVILFVINIVWTNMLFAVLRRQEEKGRFRSV